MVGNRANSHINGNREEKSHLINQKGDMMLYQCNYGKTASLG